MGGGGGGGNSTQGCIYVHGGVKCVIRKIKLITESNFQLCLHVLQKDYNYAFSQYRVWWV